MTTSITGRSEGPGTGGRDLPVYPPALCLRRERAGQLRSDPAQLPVLWSPDGPDQRSRR